MEPITVSIVAALAAGAVAATKEVATSAVKDAYAGLKRLIVDRYKKAGPFVEAIEADPTSKPEQEVLAKQLGPGTPETALKEAALALLQALEGLEADPRARAVFDFGQLRALKSFKLTDIEFAGPLFKADSATFEGDFEARGLRQKSEGQPPKK